MEIFFKVLKFKVVILLLDKTGSTFQWTFRWFILLRILLKQIPV
jgi:hypothetical protein